MALACALFGGVVTAWFVAGGLQTTYDSATYLSVAEHLVNGMGITAASQSTNSQMSIASQLAVWNRVPVTTWPPGYPVAIGLVMTLGLSALDAARVLSIGGAAVLGLGAYVGARRLLRLPVAVCLAVVVLCVVTPNASASGVAPLMGRANVWSESLFVPLASAAVLIGIEAVRRCSVAWFVAAVVTVVGASLVRLTGPICGFAIAWALLVRARSESGSARRKAAAGAAIVAASGVVALVVWTIVNRLVHQSDAVTRTIALHGLGGAVPTMFRTFGRWFGVGGSSLAPAVAIGTVLVVVPCVFGMYPRLRRLLWHDDDPVGVAVMTLSAAIVFWVLAVVATGAFLDATVGPDERLLSPVQPLAYLVTATFVYAVIRRIRVVRPGGRAACTALVGLTALTMAPSIAQLPARRAQVRAIVATWSVFDGLAEAPTSTVFVTNAPDQLWLDTGRGSLVLPRRDFIMTQTTNPHFGEDIAAIGRLARARSVIVVVSRDVNGWNEAATSALVETAGFRRVDRCGPTVRVWAVPGTSGSRTAHVLCA